MKATSLQLFHFDHEKGVHGDDLQRLKPRCLFKVELRPFGGPTFLDGRRGHGSRGVKAEQLEVKEPDQRLVLTPRHCRLGVHFGFRVETPLPSRLQAGSQYSFELWPTATIPLSLTKDLSVVPEDFDYTASISFLDVRESLPSIDPENLSPQNVLDILLYLFRQKPGFVDRGHETNNKETAWVNAFLFRLNSGVDDDGLEAFVVEVIGSSVDKMANLR